MKYRYKLLVAATAASLALAACGGGIDESAPGNDGETGNGSTEGNGDDSATAPNGDVTVLRFSTQHTENTPFSRATERWAELVEEQTEGRVKFEIYYSASLLPAAEVLPGIMDGRADAGLVVDSMFADLLPLTSSSSIPFDRTNGVAQALAFQELYDTNEDYRAEFEKLGIHVLKFQVGGATSIGSRAPIDSLGDLRGQDIRCIGYTCDALQAIGANPTALASTDIYEAMDRNTVDGWTSYPFMDMLATQFQEVTPYVTDPGLGLYLQIFTPINLDVWNSLEPQDQEVLTALARDYPDMMAEEIYVAERETCGATTAAGVTLSTLSDSERTEWSDSASDAIFEAWSRNVTSSTDVDPQTFYADLMSAYDDALAETDFESLYDQCMNGDLD